MRTNRIGFLSALLLAVFLMMGSATDLRAQSFDHEPYPKLDFDFISLDLNLGVQPQNMRIDGQATYQVEANISGADTLTLYASHLDISNVSVNGESADFSLQNDSLFVPVDDSAEAGSRYEVNIRYSGRPQFGMLQDHHETVWTSFLPKAQRHWVPIVDHPQVTLRTNFTIAVPSGVQVWATGKKVDEEVVSVDAMRYRFASQRDVPASALMFTIGDFEQQSTGYGIKKINVAVEKSLSEQVDPKQLLQKAYDYLGMVEDEMEREYPFEELQVVALEDHHGETKSWGASTIYVYENRGNIDVQLVRGIIGQWFGVQQRERQWSQADAINLYQTLVFDNVMSNDSLLNIQDDPKGFTEGALYQHFGPNRWNEWQRGIEEWKNESIRSFLKGSIGKVFEKSNVIRWGDYAEYWYEHTGQPLFDMPRFSFEKEGTTSRSDSVAYEVHYDFNEAEGALTLNFKATQGYFGELTTLQAYEIYPGKVDTSEVTFTGKEDTIVLQVDPTINTLRLAYDEYPTLTLDQFKPSSFLINELRSDAPVEQRAEAAQKLGHHSDNPDLQLAIQDFMKRDLEPEVEAGLYLSLAEVTDGASGTEEMFLDALQSDHRVIREAGLMALQNYPENANVINTVRSVAQGAEDNTLFQKSVQVLTTVMNKESFGGFVESVVQSDTVGTRSVFAIQELANMGQVEKAVEQANLFIEKEYTYEIRSRAYQLLIQHDHSAVNWLGRAENLAEISDPRIRFFLMRGLERNANDEIRSYLSDYRQDEYDERVYRRIMDIL
ncbi:hypothetical protein [Fodinibius sp. Rm-B-1B1-1]|uniref:hypothetical protein n=1 Tax=Fodinibius alkaliphilus TaxID=3140241 RepID=UPI00315AE57D